MIRDSFTTANIYEDILTLVAGDSDYAPAVKQLRANGFVVDVVFWKHASRQLKKACSNFIPLDEHLDILSF
jgi:uncharacterized LabA/DUF88 family protein